MFSASSRSRRFFIRSASVWMGRYFKEQCGVEDRRSDAALAAEWAAREAFYEEMKAAQYKQLEEEGAVTRYK